MTPRTREISIKNAVSDETYNSRETKQASKRVLPIKTTLVRKNNYFKDPGNLFGPRSIITKLDLSTFLSDDRVWHGLTEEQKTILKSICSQDCTWGRNSSEQPSLGLLLYDMHWKSDVRIFEENLKDGYCEPEWIEEAQEAISNKVNGKFDNWKLRNFEEYWGQKMTVKNDLIGNKQKVMLMDLFMVQELQLGDEWTYSRSFGIGNRTTTVEHKFEMSGMDDYGKVEFRISLPLETVSLRKRSHDEIADENEEENQDEENDLQCKKVKQNDLVTDNICKEDVSKIQRDFTPSVRLDEKTNSMEQLPTKLRQRRSNRHKSLTEAAPPDSKFTPNEAQDNAFIKSVFKKPKMAITSITTHEVDDFEKQLLDADGRGLKCGKSDSWKYFAIRRSGQDIGSLFDIRQRIWEKKE